MIRRIGEAEIEIDDQNHTVTSRFPDGHQLTAVANFTPEDVDRARSLGYVGTAEEVVLQMTREHDVLHHVVATAQGWPYSMVLWSVAKGNEHPPGFGNQEERLVFLLARALNEGRAILP